jgi:glycosyltransferase involved in cell wall biosynthesis
MSSLDMTNNGAGQLYLKAIISTAPSIQVINTRLPGGEHLEYSPEASRMSRVVSSLASRFGLWQSLKITLYERKQLLVDMIQAQELIKSHNAESVWIVLLSPECILLAHSLIKNGVKLRVTILDVPEYLFASRYVSRNIAKRLLNLFAEILRGAISVSVISAKMQDRYRKLYGIDTVVIRPISPIPIERRSTSCKRRTLRIVFAGSLYAKDEWNALLESLTALQWKIADRNIVIYFLGAFPLYGAACSRRVKRLGYLPSAEAAAIARKCDVAYLPYWFSSTNALVSATSFPSKLGFYLASGLPVFNHGPNTSEVTSLMQDFNIGVSCHSLKVEDIATALERLVRLEQISATQHEIRDLVISEMSSQSVGRKFVEFISK